MAYVSSTSYGGDPIFLLLGNSKFTGGMSGMGDLGDVIAGVSGLGDIGYSGPIWTPAGIQNVSLTSDDLAAAQAMIWKVPVSQVTQFPGGFANSGYFQNILQYIQQGALVYDPASKSWSLKVPGLGAPSAAAAAAYQAAAAASPFATPVTSPGFKGSPVYSQPQNPAAVLASAPSPVSAASRSYSPQLSFQTSAGGNSLSVGDTWTISITGAPPNSPVSVTGNTAGNKNDSITTPMGSTDGNGNFSLQGRAGPGDVGIWAETWSVGGQTVGSFAFTVSATTPAPPAGSGATPPPAPSPSAISTTCDPGINPAACGSLSPGSYFQQRVSIGGFNIPVWGFIVAAGGAALLLLGEKG